MNKDSYLCHANDAYEILKTTLLPVHYVGECAASQREGVIGASWPRLAVDYKKPANLRHYSHLRETAIRLARVGTGAMPKD
jgi:hypothetical protein